MRITAAGFWIVLISSCAPVVKSPPQTAARIPMEVTPMMVAAEPKPLAPAHPLESARTTHETVSGITFEGVAFDSRSHRLVVVDQADGPGSEFPDAASAGRSRGGLAAVNAGFFTLEGAPLGLVVSGGKRSGAWNATTSLGSGVWFEDPAENSAITRREKLGKYAASAMRELIQAGPMLIDHGRPVAGLDSSKHSARTFLLWDGKTRWWLGYASPCSLADLAMALSRAHPADWPVRHALNLDGGRSSDLWVSGAVDGGPLVRRPPWNRPVRNFLILQPR